MRCHRCPSRSIYNKERLCHDHFLSYYYKKIDKVLHGLDILNQRLLIGISGGKDSASVAYALSKYTSCFELLYLDLGITDYSRHSLEACLQLASLLGKRLHTINFLSQHFTIEHINHQLCHSRLRGTVCGTCGLSKRFFLNKYSFENGFSAVITGHNLDDELSFLIINLKNQDLLQLSRTGPIIKSDPALHLVAKIKPLYYLTEKENRLFAILNNLPHYSGECPYAKNNQQIKIKEHLNSLEDDFPKFKYTLSRSLRKLIAASSGSLPSNNSSTPNLITCPRCCYPTIIGRTLCRFCTLSDTLSSSR